MVTYPSKNIAAQLWQINGTRHTHGIKNQDRQGWEKFNQIFLLLSTNVKLCVSSVIPIMHVKS